MSHRETADSLLAEIGAGVAKLESRLPSSLDAMAVSRTAKLPFKVLSFRETLLWRLSELGRSAFENFEKEHLASAIVLTRAGVETSAALWFLRGKVQTALEKRTVGNLDEHLMRLLMGSRTDPDLPQAINVLNFIDSVNESLGGARHNYDVLSEFAHPNWAGTSGLFATVDMENCRTAFGRNSERTQPPKMVGLFSLSLALDMGDHTYESIGEMIPEFTKLCEQELNEQGPS